MKKELLEFLGKAKDSISHHSPEILVACGITGMITATALAIRATPKAEKAIEEKKEELEVEHLTKIDLAKTVWKFYIPTIALTVVSAGCLIGSVNISTRRTAALATAYQVIDTNYREYKEKVAETFGETKEKKVSNDVAQDKVTKNPVKNSAVCVSNGGNTLCYDETTARYFRCDVATIKKAENLLNRCIRDDNYASLNVFYGFLGLEGTSIGDDIGWNIDDPVIELELNTCLSDNDEPCLVIGFNKAPHYKFDRFF